jgi:hypothetical protein
MISAFAAPNAICKNQAVPVCKITTPSYLRFDKIYS